MKKKVILLTVLALLVLGSVVSAAGVWGTYKGNNIARITVEGVPTKVNDVPAINYLGRTMIPIYLLQQADISYTWDGSNQTVDLKKPEPVTTIVTKTQTVEKPFSLFDLAKEMKQHDVLFIDFVTDGETFSEVKYYYEFDPVKLNSDMESFGSILDNSMKTDATFTTISYDGGETLTVPTQGIRDFRSGKITSDDLARQYVLKGFPQQSASAPATPSTPSGGAPVVNINQPEPQVHEEPQANNSPPSNVCQQIRDNHILQDVQFESSSDPMNKQTALKKQILEKAQADELAANGC